MNTQVVKQKYYQNEAGEVFCIDIMPLNAESWTEEVKTGWQEISKKKALELSNPPKSAEQLAQEKQLESGLLLAQAAQKISEYQDLLEFAANEKEAKIGSQGLEAWRRYRAELLKYQKNLINDLPLQPE